MSTGAQRYFDKKVGDTFICNQGCYNFFYVGMSPLVLTLNDVCVGVVVDCQARL